MQNISRQRYAPHVFFCQTFSGRKLFQDNFCTRRARKFVRFCCSNWHLGTPKSLAQAGKLKKISWFYRIALGRSFAGLSGTTKLPDNCLIPATISRLASMVQ
jgi:hypothetical protein